KLQVHSVSSSSAVTLHASNGDSEQATLSSNQVIKSSPQEVLQALFTMLQQANISLDSTSEDHAFTILEDGCKDLNPEGLQVVYLLLTKQVLSQDVLKNDI